jgi:parallel beta-helix repeat protein
MTAVFPNEVRLFDPQIDGVSTIDAEDVNALYDEVTAVETYLLAEVSPTAGHIVEDEGTPLTQRAKINFIGAGVTATDDSGNAATVVTIPGAAWLNVKDYGAIGDGATDDTAAIQAALTAAAGNGLTVYFPAGYYRVTATLLYGGNTSLLGEYGSSWLVNYISASPWILFTADPGATVENVVIQNLCFDQRVGTYGFDTASYCLGINEAQNIRIERCIFTSIITMAIWCDTKAADTQTRNVLINGCWIENSEAGGISLFGNIADATIVNCLIENCKDDGIAFQDLATGEFPNGIVIANNQILSCDQRNSSGSTPAGIRIFGGTNAAVDGNYIDKTVSANIMVQAGNSIRSSSVVLSNNICRRSGVTVDDTTGVPVVGIYCYNADYVNVIGNEVHDSQVLGIAVTDCDQVILISNQLSNNTVADVDVTTSTNVKQWMSGGANQVKGGLNVGTALDQTEGRLTIKGNTDAAATQIYIYPSEDTTSERAAITMDNWQIGQDLDANGVKDFYIYDAGATTRMRISPAGITRFFADTLEVYGDFSAYGDVLLGGSSDKIGLYGAAAVARATTGGAAAAFTQNSGTAVNDASTFDGYTLKQIVKALRQIGVLT